VGEPGQDGFTDTERFLVEAGLCYTGDDASDDLPFVQNVGGDPGVRHEHSAREPA
jgi:hypothetical protein